MPEKILTIAGTTGSGDFTTHAGSAASGDMATAVDPGDPISHDDATTFVKHPSPGQNHLQEFTMNSMPGAATGVRQVDLHIRYRNHSTASMTIGYYVKLNSTLGTEFSATLGASNGSYENFASLDIPRPGGGNWTLADLADASFELALIYRDDPTSDVAKVTSFWALVTYDQGDAPLDGFREVAGRRIRVLQHGAGVTKIEVPLMHLELDIFDDLGLAHDSVARAAELLTNLQEHGLIDNWRRQYSAILGMDLNMNGAGSLTMDLLDMEPGIVTIFDTLSMPIAITPDASISEAGLKRYGVTSWNAGALRTESRTDHGFIVAADELKGVVQLTTILDGIAKMNHRGMIAEDAFTNEVDNSCFIDGLTGWTTNLGTGGTIALDATVDPALFKDTGPGQQIVKITKGSSGAVSLTRFDVGSSTGDRRVSFWCKDDDSGIAEWDYQRAGGGSDWWNDATEAWQSAKVWNQVALDSDGKWTRIVSKRLTGVTSGDGRISIGNSTGSNGDAFWVGQNQAVEKGYITSDAITDDTPFQIGGAVDRIYDEMSLPVLDQVVHPDRYTVRVTMRAYQDSDGITEGVANRHVLWTARWNADNDRDEASIEKVSGQVRFAFRRFIAGSEDALAFVNVTLTEGTEYELAFRSTSASNGELGLAARTMSAFADGVKGTDDAASAIHSTATSPTQFYYGSTTSGTGLLAAANYIRNLEAVQRCIPDSEILGRRP